MRADVLQDRKGIHVKLDKETHAQLRTKCFQYGLSMQEVFEEFARQLATDEFRAVRIVENLVSRKVQAQLDGEPRRKRRRSQGVGELDQDTLYNLISEENSVPSGSASGGRNEAA
jgi:hypothetical protein